MSTVLYIIACLSYLGLGISLWLSLYHNKPIHLTSGWYRYLLLITLTIHGIAVNTDLVHYQHIRLSWSLGLSLTVWIMLLIFWIERLWVSIDGLLLSLLPLAAIITFCAAIFPSNQQTQIIIPINSEIFRLHILSSIIAYSLIAIAALHSGIMVLFDNYLHRRHHLNPNRLLVRAIDMQPPLMTQERLLFSLLWIGFITLTFAIITGAYVSLQINHILLPFDHKTVLTILSWIVFAVLLFGRVVWGWRGRFALRCTIIGFTLLLLGFTGSKFVLDVILNKL